MNEYISLFEVYMSIANHVLPPLQIPALISSQFAPEISHLQSASLSHYPNLISKMFLTSLDFYRVLCERVKVHRAVLLLEYILLDEVNC